MSTPLKWTVPEIQRALQPHQAELERLGVGSLAVFGFVGRGEATDASDIDLVTRKAFRARLQPVVEREAVRVA